MLISIPQKVLVQSLKIAVNDSVVEAKILRVTFDHAPSWEKQIESL